MITSRSSKKLGASRLAPTDAHLWAFLIFFTKLITRLMLFCHFHPRGPPRAHFESQTKTTKNAQLCHTFRKKCPKRWECDMVRKKTSECLPRITLGTPRCSLGPPPKTTPGLIFGTFKKSSDPDPPRGTPRDPPGDPRGPPRDPSGAENHAKSMKFYENSMKNQWNS